MGILEDMLERLTRIENALIARPPRPEEPDPDPPIPPTQPTPGVIAINGAGTVRGVALPVEIRLSNITPGFHLHVAKMPPVRPGRFFLVNAAGQPHKASEADTAGNGPIWPLGLGDQQYRLEGETPGMVVVVEVRADRTPGG